MSVIADLEVHLAPALAERLADARAAEERGQLLVARAHYETVLRGLRGAAAAPLAAALVRWVGRLHLQEGDLDAAADCLVASLAVAEAAGDESGTAHAVNLMAIVHLHRGLLDEAEALHRQALDRAGAAGDAQLCALAEHNLGIIAMIRGDFDGAAHHYHVSLDGFRALGLHTHVTQGLNNLGMLYTEARQWEAAERAYADAVASCEGAGGHTESRVMIEVNRTGLWIARRDFSQARASCDNAAALAAAVGNERALAEVHKFYGAIAREAGQFGEAEDHLAIARSTAEAREDLLLAAEVAREQAELAWAQRHGQETLQHLNRAHRLFTTLRAQRLAADVDRRMARLETVFLDIVRGWIRSIEAVDRYTGGHCDRVAEYACALAAESGFDSGTLFWFRMGALLHDVGKIVVPGAILNKPGPLTAEERAVMQSHPMAGVEMLADIDFPWDILPMVRHHHEQWNGGGYPDGLAGEEIPLSARILCVADVYDALTSARPYRPAYNHAQAIEAMEAMHGVFDPVLFARFVRIVEREKSWPIDLGRRSASYAAAALPPESAMIGQRVAHAAH